MTLSAGTPSGTEDTCWSVFVVVNQAGSETHVLSATVAVEHEGLATYKT